MGRFDEMHWRSLDDPETFWSEGAAAIDWDEPWSECSTTRGRRSTDGSPAGA